ncbi:GSU2403 family nucleotidyltransferase fold protein [Agrobacterium sp. V1]|uniref:GSU2403 family nucleotidyltransferase fold protein n=1 Tax=Agrobacterium sp. V1 TaxID=3061957 RepID=UPI0034A05356
MASIGLFRFHGVLVGTAAFGCYAANHCIRLPVPAKALDGSLRKTFGFGKVSSS